ncbi:hypothetical protein BDY17DRAFT_306021 [Neohortaea acidophila]|uniref:ER membrane protein complex subunit 7 beta-sandwich domain-containing protein n=1 Tax=Neohortaea acidophila TaxID=245834 RepID=A0A6A6PGJ6_9PEZI|nr:uncharacterized protein BDY17DRAFT_306021 [Neohortaea acidophila]KAF2478906.1 hypothetical protein BDY17DRAFT_306021 [Neohortaea acidophila]
MASVRLLSLTLFGFLVGLATSAQLSVGVQSSQLLPNPSTLPPSTHAVLLGPPGIRYDVPLRRDNTFHFPDLAEASYLLTVHCRDHFFAPLRVDVTKSEVDPSQHTLTAWQTFRGNEWEHKGAVYGSAQESLTIQIPSGGAKDFYQARGGFSLMGFVKSPMILLSLGAVVMIFGMPYMMDNMDEETKKEFQELQRKQPLTGEEGAATQLQNFDLAGWMAGKSSGSSTPNTGGGGAKRR